MEKQFDPNKQYQWQPEQDVLLTGQQFGILQNFISDYLQNAPQIAFKALNANSVLAQIIQHEVEEGRFTERVPDPTVNPEIITDND